MRSALYYPHTTVQNENLIKTALLLWDRLEYIVPDPDFQPHYERQDIASAIDLIGIPHVPNDDEKKAAHRRLEEAVSQRLPPQFYLSRQFDQRLVEPYEIYPDKLLPGSWDLLHRARLAAKPISKSEIPLREAGGLMVMSILADCCAGTTRSRVTDRGSAYATLAGLLGNDFSGPKVRKADAHGQFVPLSLKILDVSRINIAALTRLRQREAKESGHSLRDLRHRYVDGFATYVDKLVSEKSTKADAKEIQRQFISEMETDLKDLKSELGFARNEAFFSAQFFTTVVAATGTVASWLFGLPLELEGVITAGGTPAAIGGLLGAQNKYLKERQAVMKRHPMAYLFEARRLGDLQ